MPNAEKFPVVGIGHQNTWAMDSLDSDWSRQKSIFSDWLEQLKSIIENGNLKEKNVGRYSNLRNFHLPSYILA